MKHVRLNGIHFLLQHVVKKCTLDVHAFRLKVPQNTYGEQSTQRSISTNQSPCLKEIDPIDLFKPLSYVSRFETLDVTLGASLDLQKPTSPE